MTPSLLLAGRYRVSSPIGQGGMSVVWEAVDEVLDRPVAIKVLANIDGQHHVAGSMIRVEAQAAARLCHPHVARVYDLGEATDENGAPVAFMVLELLSGQSLAAALSAGPLPPPAATRTALEVVSALAAAHANGVVHRDVKPGNIMMTPFGAKVFDFGIAATAGQTDPGDGTGRILGTPVYTAPERLTGATVTPSADMYAFGVLLGQLFPEPDAAPPDVDRLRRRCLAADPESRPSSTEAETVLRTAHDQPSTVVLTTAPPAVPDLPQTAHLEPPVLLPLAPARRWSLVGTALVLVAAGLACLAVAVGRSTHTAAEVTAPTTSPPAPPPPPATTPPAPATGTDTQAFASANDARPAPTSCDTKARKGNEAMTKLATRAGHDNPLTVSCRNGRVTVRLSTSDHKGHGKHGED